MAKPFAWSWSKLKNYRSCPKRHYEIDIAKTYKEDEKSPALLWGDEFHKAMADFIGKGKPLPATMERHSGWPDNIIKMKNGGLEVKVEQKLAMDNQFRATSFFDNATWFRSVADVLILIPQRHCAITIDWKTGGKVEPEFEQLALSSQTVFANYKDINYVIAIYVWAGHDRHTVKLYSRDDMVPVWSAIMPEVKQMEEAFRTLTYPPKPSGLCKRHCVVISCPHHGKGSY